MSISSILHIFRSTICVCLINQKNNLEKGTFFSVDNQDKLIFSSSENAKIFEIISPIIPSYQTYSQLR